jgi:hypothetical protein
MDSEVERYEPCANDTNNMIPQQEQSVCMVMIVDGMLLWRPSKLNDLVLRKRRFTANLIHHRLQSTRSGVTE